MRRKKAKNLLFVILSTVVLYTIAWVLIDFSSITGNKRIFGYTLTCLGAYIVSELIDGLLRKYHVMGLIKMLWLARDSEKLVDNYFGDHSPLGRHREQVLRKCSGTNNFLKGFNNVPQLARDLWAKAYKELRQKYPYEPYDYSLAKRQYEIDKQRPNCVPEFSILLKQLQDDPTTEIFITKFKSEYNSAYKGELYESYYFCHQSHATLGSKNIDLQPVPDKNIFRLTAEQHVNGEFTGNIEMTPLMNEVYDNDWERYEEYWHGCYRMSSEEEIELYKENEKVIAGLLEDKLDLDDEYKKKKKKLMQAIDDHCRLFDVGGHLIKV